MSNESKLTIFEPSEKEPRTVVLNVSQELIDGIKPIFDEHGNPSTNYRLLFDETEKAQDLAKTEKIKTYINNWQAQGTASLTSKKANQIARRKRLREFKKLKKKKKMSIINCAFDRNPLINAKDIEEEREIVRAMKAKQFNIKKILNIKPNKSISLNTNFNPVPNKKIQLNSRRPPDIVVLSDSDSDESEEYTDEDRDHIQLNIDNSNQPSGYPRNFTDDTSYDNLNSFVTSDTLARRRNRKKKVEVVDICDSSDSDVECIPLENEVESISDSDEDEEMSFSSGKNLTDSARDGDDEEEMDPEFKVVDDEVSSQLTSLVDSFVSKYLQKVIPPLCPQQVEPLMQFEPCTPPAPDSPSKSIPDSQSRSVPELPSDLLSSKSVTESQSKPAPGTSKSTPQPRTKFQPVAKKSTMHKRRQKRVTFNDSVIECEDRDYDERPANQSAVSDSVMEVEPSPATPENSPSDNEDTARKDEEFPSPENAFMYNFDSLPSPDYSPAAEIDENFNPMRETNLEELNEYMNTEVLNKKRFSTPRFQSSDPRNPQFQRSNVPVNKYSPSKNTADNHRFTYAPQSYGESRKKFDENQPEETPNSQCQEMECESSQQIVPANTSISEPNRSPAKNLFQKSPHRFNASTESSNLCKNAPFQSNQENCTPTSKGTENLSNITPEQFISTIGTRNRQYRPKGPHQNYQITYNPRIQNWQQNRFNRGYQNHQPSGKYDNRPNRHYHNHPESDQFENQPQSQPESNELENETQTPPVTQPYNFQKSQFPNQRYQNRNHYRWPRHQNNSTECFHEDVNTQDENFVYEGYENDSSNYEYQPRERFEGGENLAYEEDKFHPNQVWHRGRPYNKRFQRRQQPYFSNQNQPRQSNMRDQYQHGFPPRPRHFNNFVQPKQEERDYEENKYNPNRYPKNQQFRGNRGHGYQTPYNQRTPRFPNQYRFQRPTGSRFPQRIPPLVPHLNEAQTSNQTSQPVPTDESLFTRRSGDKFKYKANIDDFQDCVVQKPPKESDDPPMQKYEQDVLKKLQSDDNETPSDNQNHFTWESTRTFDYVAIPVNEPIESHIPPWSKENADATPTADEINAISRRSFIANLTH